ncbi:MAG: amidohydrolase family protein [Bryobacteraceae bacterium]
MTLSRRSLISTLPIAVLAGCGGSKEPKIALVGGTLINGLGEEPMADSVLVVSGGLFRSVGSRNNTAVPAGATEVDVRGKFVIPALIDVTPEGWTEPHYTEAEINRELQSALVLYGIPCERSLVPNDILDKIRNLRMPVAPMLSKINDTVQLGFAQANVKTMLESGVLVTVASGERNHEATVREILLMAGGGAEAKDLMVAATRYGATALRDSKHSGTIEAGKPADLMVLAGNPLKDLAALQKIEKVMRDGAWKEW